MTSHQLILESLLKDAPNRFSKMVILTKDNGTHKKIKDAEEESKLGQTEPFMKDIGRMTKEMVKVGLFIPMVMSLRAIGKTTELTSTDNLLI
jgi:hypothetical protein